MKKLFSYAKNHLNYLDILVLIVVFLIGVIHLFEPFSYDQSLFIIGAKAINEGKLLYRDFWDWKQPGIYGFYFVGGRLFGFNEVGIHTFELIYQMLLAVVLQFTMRNYYHFRAIASIVPLLTVGTYYSIANHWQFSQVETLAGFPLFLCLWFANQAAQFSRRRVLWLWLSGLMGSVVLLFKLMFLPIILAFWIITLFAILKQRPKSLKLALFQFGVALGLGIVLPLLPILVYFAQFDQLRLVYKTFFVYPPRANAQTFTDNAASIQNQFINGLGWFVQKMVTFIPLGLIGAAVSFSHQKNRLTLFFSVWFLLGCIVIWIQLTSLWQYHYFLLLVPLGILAAKGLDIIWGKIHNLKVFSWGWRSVFIVTFGLILLLSPILKSLVKKSITLVQYRFALSSEQRFNYQRHLLYATFLEEVAFLAEPRSLPGDIYVFGNNLYYYLSGRGQAIAINGSYPPTLLPEHWLQILEELQQVRPPYIFVNHGFKNIIARRSPDLIRWLEQNYRIIRESNAGNWYILATTNDEQN